MNPIGREEVFYVRDYAGKRKDFMWEEEVTAIERALLQQIEKLGPFGTLVVNFEGVTLASDAARRLLKRAIQRIQGGDWKDRAIVLTGLARGVYNVRVMLLSEQLAVVARGESGRATLMGDAEPAVTETYDFLVSRGSGTARDVQNAFGLNTVAAATNRLIRLAKLGAARRIAQESVEGGGMQYRYAAVR
jgi:hypothetical protein